MQPTGPTRPTCSDYPRAVGESHFYHGPTTGQPAPTRLVQVGRRSGQPVRRRQNAENSSLPPLFYLSLFSLFPRYRLAQVGPWQYQPRIAALLQDDRAVSAQFALKGLGPDAGRYVPLYLVADARGRRGVDRASRAMAHGRGGRVGRKCAVVAIEAAGFKHLVVAKLYIELRRRRKTAR